MSEPAAQKPPARLLRPATLLAGFAVGMAVLAWKGREVGDSDWHPDFTRFHPMISPAALYEPTVSEMCAVVRARCRPDQVLVIVGGNSIFLGVGQPADKMWTRHLQEDLGDRYAVVNLAFRGSVPVDCGAVVAEALRREFPRQIYIANAVPLQGADSIGLDTYRFALLDAYYKGLLLPWAPRDEALSKFTWTQDRKLYPQLEKNLGAKLDAWLYFRTLWTWYSYTYHFTFATPFMPHDPEAHYPRSYFKDEENDFEATPFEVRYTPQTIAADLNISNQYTASFFNVQPDGSWRLSRGAFAEFMKDAEVEFPDPLKPRTLIVLSRNSPYYTRQLSPEVRARDERAIQLAILGLKHLGYDSIDYGADFAVEDYGDRTHLTSTGGVKLAARLAPEVQALAERLNYLKP